MGEATGDSAGHADDRDNDGLAAARIREDSVTLEQLKKLLAYEHEMETLDFKRWINLSDRVALMELAKDVGAMQVEGGWIVVGADDCGRPAPPGVEPDDRTLFDEARLRPMLAKYIPEPFEIHTAVHTIGDCTFAVIRVVPRASGFCVFKINGEYSDKQGAQKFVFREGDVFVRHNTSSERWKQHDIDRIIERLVQRRKESWWAEHDEQERRRQQISNEAVDIAHGSVSDLSWRTEAETFDVATLELFRANDDIPLRRMLNEAVATAAGMVADADRDRGELEIIVGRVTSITALAITYRRPEWFEQARSALSKIYRLGYDSQGLNRHDGVSEEVWLLVLEHVLGLGALAVRQQDWEAVRALATTDPGGADAGERYPSWMRHAVTMAARGRKLDDGKSLVTLATERVAALRALRPDVPADDRHVITSICQYDLLAVLAIIAATGSMSGGIWYPNFARFYSARSEPALQQLICDPEMRSILFPRSDDELAAVLSEVSRIAAVEGSRFNGWTGFHSESVERFLAAHQT